MEYYSKCFVMSEKRKIDLDTRDSALMEMVMVTALPKLKLSLDSCAKKAPMYLPVYLVPCHF